MARLVPGLYSTVQMLRVSSIFSDWSLVGEHVLANVEEATTSGGAKNIFKGDQAIYIHTHEECL